MASFQDRVRLAAKAAVGIFSDNSLKQAWGMLSGVLPGGVGMPPPKGTVDYLRAYSTMPWLRAVSGRVSTAVARTEWQLYVAGKPREKARMQKDVAKSADREWRQKQLKELKDKEELRQIVEHPMLDLLRDANEFQTGYAARKITQLHYDLVGDAFWLKERDAQGMPIAIWPIPPHWIINTPTPNFRFFRVNFRAWRGNIPDTEFVWFSDPDPMNPYARGTGTAMALGDELETDEYAARHTKAFFYNSARPDLIVWPKNGSSRSEDVKRIEEDWMSKAGGVFRAFKPYFLTREVGIETLDQNFRSMTLVQLREFERNVIMQMFGIPPEILGVLTSSNRSTIDAADYFMSKYVIEPRLEYQRQVMQERLAPEFDERLIVEYVSPVAEDDEKKLAAMTRSPWAASVDEHRATMGLPPLEDKEAGKLHLVTGGRLQPIEEAEEPVMPPGFPGGPGAPGSPNPAAPGARPGQAPPDPKETEPGQGRRAVGWRAEAAEEAEFAKSVDDAELADQIGKLLRENDSLPAASAEAARHEPTLSRKLLATWRDHAARVDTDRLTRALERGSVNDAAAALDTSGLAAAERSAVVPVLVRAGLQGAELGAYALRRNGVPVKGLDDVTVRARDPKVVVDLRAVNPHVTAWAEEHAARLVRASDDVKEVVRLMVAEANERGIPPRELAKSLEDVVGLLPRQVEAVNRFQGRLMDEGVPGAKIKQRVERYARAQQRARAMTIARTETIGMVNAGQQMLWEEAARSEAIDAEDFVREWIATDDDRLCQEVCEPLDGTHAAIDEPFDGDVMQPPAHVTCRCAMALVPDPTKGAAAVREKYRARAKGDPDQPRDDHGRWSEAGGGGFDAPALAEAHADYKQRKGTDAKNNEAIVRATGVKLVAPEKLRAAATEAVAHVASEKSLAEQMAGMKVEFKELGTLHGTSKARTLYIDSASAEKHGPGFAASIVRHELEHTKLSKEGVPSSQQEQRVRRTAGVWAGLKYASMAKTNPTAAAGFKKAAQMQGVKVG